MIEKITNNWGLKLLSIVVAFLLWAMIVNYQDPLVTETFNDIPVNKINTSVIESQNQAIEYEDGETVDLILRGKRSIIYRLTEDDITAYADLSKVSITNAVDIEVDVDGAEVLRKEPSKMIISLERILSIQRDVQVYYNGNLPEDYVKLSPTLSENQIEITGPESKLAQIVSVIVPINMEGAIKDVVGIVTPKVLDSNNEDVRDISVSLEKIQVTVPVQKVKTIPVVFQTVGSINDSYRLMSMKMDVSTVQVRGTTEDIDDISRIVITNVDLSALTDEVTEIPVVLTDYLPDGINLYESPSEANILVEVEPIIERTYTIEQVDINVRYLADNLQFKFLTEDAHEVVLRGIAADLDSISVDEDLRPFISVSTLGEGVHTLEIQIYVGTGLELVSELPTVDIELVQADTVEETGATESTGTNN